MGVDIWELARPRKPVRTKVKLLGGLAVLETEEGALAVVPVDEVCKLAERYNLMLEGFNCGGKSNERAAKQVDRLADKPGRRG